MWRSTRAFDGDANPPRYLFAASQGLAAWFHNCNKPELAAALKLRPEQRVLFAQTVGYPAKG
jgi:hypothetical protein